MDTVLVRGLLVIEHFFPMPARVGKPLPIGHVRARNADPVILVGGYANSASGWDEWKRSLEADGFQVFIFQPPTTGLGDMEDSAKAVAAFILEVRRKTGRKVDVVGFSEGGVLARMAVARLGALGSVDKLVSLATPHGGIALNGLYDALAGIGALKRAIPAATAQLLDGSELLLRIARDDAALRRGLDPRAPRYASVFSRTLDPIIAPWSSMLGGAVNVPVAADQSWRTGPNHFEMFHTSNRAYEATRSLLLDESDTTIRRAALGVVDE
ncbi:MAG: lipase [Thermoleophilia bacterium]|nr:lipase [Thermoleophilia bacterium]